MGKKETYTTMDLTARYGVCLRTLRAWENKRGFPHGAPFSKVIIWSLPKVHEWEKEHMPHLHNGAHAADDSEDWERMKRGEIEVDVPKKKTKARRKH